MSIQQIKSGSIASVASSTLIGQVPDANAPSGSVIQVVQTVKTDTFSTSSTTFTDITGFSVSITPTSSSSKILVLYTTNTCADVNFTGYAARLVRNSTAIFVGDAAGSRPQATLAGTSVNIYDNSCVSGQYLDSPATTSSTTYKVQLSCTNGSPAVFVNRSIADRDTSAYDVRMASSIIVMEIAA
jgi:hypothetical protein